MTRTLERFWMESDGSVVASGDGETDPARAVPHLAPEVVLLYKLPRFGDHDRRDLEACLPALHDERRAWLERAIETVDPDHPWLEELR